MNARIVLSALSLVAAAVLVGQLSAGGDRAGALVPEASHAAGGIAGAGDCTPGIGPDVIVGDLAGISKWGVVGNITGYSFGTTSCNVGDQTLQWDADTENHPVIAQNMYRYLDGRFEQIGMSWLKHGFAAVTGNLCCTCQNPGDSQVLGIGCSDPYGSGLNGDQDGLPGACGINCGGLGPRWEVNATTGAFVYPYDAIGVSGDAIYKRLQVLLDDIDPALNVGATYYGEGHYVTPDDAAAANHHNNVSYEQIVVSIFQGGSWILLFTGETTRERAAVYAWQDNDPEVVIQVIEDDGDPQDDHDGRFHLGYRVTDNGDGTWHYEYALHNMNSHRSAKAFIVPVADGVTLSNIGFHDVDYHSGDGNDGVNFDGTDWTVTMSAAQIIWSTQGIGSNPNANALRWGTMYNFRFDADAPPVEATVIITPFRFGGPLVLETTALAPVAPGPPGPCPWDLDGDGLVGITDFLALLAEWGTAPNGPPDFDGDGTVGITDMLEILSRWGDCPSFPGCGDPASGSCFEANGTPGCASLDCCETVCAQSPACCEVAWDVTCKDLANSLCGNCGDPLAGDCCVANGTPGCDDATCCREVCAIDPVCCAGAWDLLCASQAVSICGCP